MLSVYQTLPVSVDACVMGVTKTGNIVLREGLEPTSLAFQAIVLPLHHVGFSDVTTVTMPTLPQRSV